MQIKEQRALWTTSAKTSRMRFKRRGQICWRKLAKQGFDALQERHPDIKCAIAWPKVAHASSGSRRFS